MSTINIAIDGPAGAGKSTIAKMVSAEMGYIYVDTGALYRTIALYLTENNIADEDIEKSLENSDVSLKFIDGTQRVYLGNRDVSGISIFLSLSGSIFTVIKLFACGEINSIHTPLYHNSICGGCAS